MRRWTTGGMGAWVMAAAWLSGSSPAATAEENVRFVSRGGGGGHLGVSLEDVRKEDVSRLKLPAERGALVQRVEPGTAADKAGLKEGDVILRYQGETVQSAAQLARLIHETPSGRSVVLDVNRQGTAQTLNVALEEGGNRFFSRELVSDWVGPMPPMPPMPPDAGMPKWGKEHSILRGFLGEAREPRRLGIEYQEISGQLARYFHVSGEQGILIAGVDEDGPASRAGCRAGDVLVKLGSREIRDSRDLHEALGDLKPGQATSVSVLRDGHALELKLTPAAPQGERGPTI